MTSFADIGPTDFSRAMLVSAAAALVGIGLAGFSLFTAKGTSTLATPPEDVALVNQQPISRSDFDYQLRTLYQVGPAAATPAQRHKVLEDMIREELFVQRGKELDVAAFDPEVRTATVAAVEQEIAADALSTRVDGAALQAYYAAHADRYAGEGSMDLRDLVFPAATATAARAALAGGAQVDAVLQRFMGREAGSTQGSDFYFAARLKLGEPLFDMARTLADGAMSAPIAAAGGAHLLLMTRNIRPLRLPFAQARAEVLKDYLDESRVRALRADEGYLRKRANVLVAADLR